MQSDHHHDGGPSLAYCLNRAPCQFTSQQHSIIAVPHQEPIITISSMHVDTLHERVMTYHIEGEALDASSIVIYRSVFLSMASAMLSVILRAAFVEEDPSIKPHCILPLVQVAGGGHSCISSGQTLKGY